MVYCFGLFQSYKNTKDFKRNKEKLFIEKSIRSYTVSTLPVRFKNPHAASSPFMARR